MYLSTIAEDAATGQVAAIYKGQTERMGFVMAAAKCLTAREDLLPIYNEFVDRVRAGFSLGAREWRLITLIAAKQVRSTYCSYVYGRQLIEDLGSKDAVLAVQRNFRTAGLPLKEVAMLDYAEKVARDATQVTQHDIERLRRVGFSDTQICDIAVCAAFRCFVGKLFDALGAGPEAAFIDNDIEWCSALAVGKAY